MGTGNGDNEKGMVIMARIICNVCNTRTVYTGTGAGVDVAPRASEMCNLCYTEGSWENSHSDEGHELDIVDTSDNGCWICHPKLNLALKPKAARTGHTNTAPKTHTSHAGCTHSRTPKARAACRKANTWNGTAWVAN